MAIDRKQPGPALPLDSRGNVIVDDYRGQLRVRAWPRKRGRPKHYKVKWLSERFGEAAKLIKYANVIDYQRAVELAHGTGMYPQDWLRSTALGGPWDFETTDGELLRRYQPMVHPVQFQGFRLIRTSNLTQGAGTSIPVPWQSPQLQTAPFWNPGDPTVITIPENVENIALFAGVRWVTSNNGTYAINIRKSGTIIYVGSAELLNGNHTIAVATGPIPVAEGDTFHLQAFASAGNSIEAGPATFISGQILGAV